MSTRIVDRIEAIRFPAADIGHYEDVFLVMELGGDNNVTNMRGQRARSWSATCIGPDWSVIGDACRFAAGCSGGMTKLHGRATTPESYIRAYRKALASAVSYKEALIERRLFVEGKIRFDPTDKSSAYYMQQAMDAGKYAYSEKRYDKSEMVIGFNLNDPADLALWFKCEHGPGWNNAEVTGPDTH